MGIRKYLSILLGFYSQFLIGQNLGFPLDPCPPNSYIADRDCHEIWRGPGDGETVNGFRQGYWRESFGEMPYAEGNYLDGKKEGAWKFYVISSKKISGSKKLANIRDFKNAKIHCTANFLNGKLIGEFKLYKNNILYLTSNYNNDTLIDLLKIYDNKNRLIYIGDFNNTYFDTACYPKGSKITLEEYLFCKLPFSKYFEYSSKKDWFEFEGYMKFQENVFDENWYLVYDKSKRQLILERLKPTINGNQKAEGLYKLVSNNQIETEFEIKKGRKKIVKQSDIK